jgi:hypothetical protein
MKLLPNREHCGTGQIPYIQEYRYPHACAPEILMKVPVLTKNISHCEEFLLTVSVYAVYLKKKQITLRLVNIFHGQNASWDSVYTRVG